MWSAFTRTMKYAADGLKQASGQRDLKHIEKHHLITNKHKTKPIECKEIIDRYNYSLNHASNLVELKGHRGRHTNAYHDFITVVIKELDIIADGSIDIFIEGMEKLGEFILDNWWIPYAQSK